MARAIGWLLVGMPMWLGMTSAPGSPAAFVVPGLSAVRTMAPSPRTSPSLQPSDGLLMLTGDNGPHGSGTNPYVVAIVHLRGDGDVTQRIEDLRQRYRFSWDGAVLPGSNDVAIRIALHRADIQSLAREAGVARVEPISGSPF